MHTCTCTQFTVSDQDVEALATVGLATSKAADVISSSKLLPVRVHKSKERRWERGKTVKGRPQCGETSDSAYYCTYQTNSHVPIYSLAHKLSLIMLT